MCVLLPLSVKNDIAVGDSNRQVWALLRRRFSHHHRRWGLGRLDRRCSFVCTAQPLDSTRSLCMPVRCPARYTLFRHPKRNSHQAPSLSRHPAADPRPPFDPCNNDSNGTWRGAVGLPKLSLGRLQTLPTSAFSKSTHSTHSKRATILFAWTKCCLHATKSLESSALQFGVTSTVWLARDLTGRRYVALKIFVGSSCLGSDISQELKAYQRLEQGLTTHPGRQAIRPLIDSRHLWSQ